jgi:hypothetical protein
MIKTRHYPVGNSECDRMRLKIFKKREWFNTTYYPKIRNTAGEILVISKLTKQIWKHIKKCKTIPTFIKYGNEFLKSIEQDSRNIRNKEHWAKRIDTNGIIHESRGGRIAPTIVITKHTTYKQNGKVYGKFGSYNWKGLAHAINNSNSPTHCIEISKDRKLEEMKKTFIHETLHYLDTLSETPDNNHDKYWDMRLKKLELLFPLNNSHSAANKVLVVSTTSPSKFAAEFHIRTVV